MTERLLRRREAILTIGAGLGSVLDSVRRGGVDPASAATCMLSPEQMEGPFYVAGEPFRRDVTEGLPGVPLQLKLQARRASTCRWIKGATVEIWHTDAAGDYSGVNGATTTFMRGQQTTDGAAPVSGAVVHTGQLYFDDLVTDIVHGVEPYASRGPRDTTNSEDFIFASGGAESMLMLRKRRTGYAAMAILVVNA